MKTLEVKTSVIRTNKAEGLIRARLMGAKKAASSATEPEVLVFLDAHVEVSKGWLVPILSEIAGDRTRVVMPVIDEIDHKTFKYDPVDDDHERGGMDWKLMHFWIGSGKWDWLPGQMETDAFPAPTMIGNLSIFT